MWLAACILSHLPQTVNQLLLYTTIHARVKVYFPIFLHLVYIYVCLSDESRYVLRSTTNLSLPPYGVIARIPLGSSVHRLAWLTPWSLSPVLLLQPCI